MWELDHKVGWALKNWCFWIVMLDKTLESPLNCKEIKLVNPKGNQSWIFIGRIDAEAPILWPPDAKSQLIRKDSDAGKNWRQEKGVTEDETVGWHHRLNGQEFEQALGNNKGQGSLACCSPWDLKESDTTERLNNRPSTKEGRWHLTVPDNQLDRRAPTTLLKAKADELRSWFCDCFPRPMGLASPPT